MTVDQKDMNTPINKLLSSKPLVKSECAACKSIGMCLDYTEDEKYLLLGNLSYVESKYADVGVAALGQCSEKSHIEEQLYEQKKPRQYFITEAVRAEGREFKVLLGTELKLPLIVDSVIADFYLCEYYLSHKELISSEKDLLNLEMVMYELLNDVSYIFDRYLYLACLTEARHIFEKTTPNTRDIEKKKITDYLMSRFYPDDRRTQEKAAIHKAILQDGKDNTDEKRLKTLHVLHECFTKLYWKISYGGDMWANIARVGIDRLEKKRALDDSKVFLDHVFSLRHNGNHFSDKNPYILYSDGTIGAVLHAQAAGKLDKLKLFCSSEVRELLRTTNKEKVV